MTSRLHLYRVYSTRMDDPPMVLVVDYRASSARHRGLPHLDLDDPAEETVWVDREQVVDYSPGISKPRDAGVPTGINEPCVLDWSHDAAIYRDLGWKIYDSHTCSTCGRGEFSEIPESAVCSECDYCRECAVENRAAGDEPCECWDDLPEVVP